MKKIAFLIFCYLTLFSPLYAQQQITVSAAPNSIQDSITSGANSNQSKIQPVLIGRVSKTNKQWESGGIFDGKKPTNEIRELRTEISKKFDMGSGIKQVIIGGPFHYLDSNGVWQDIDLTLKKSTISQYSYVNEENRFTSKFGNNFSDGILMSYKKKSLLFGKNITISAGGWHNSVSDSPNTVVNENILGYKNAYPNIDFEYEVSSDAILHRMKFNDSTALSGITTQQNLFIEEEIDLPLHSLLFDSLGLINSDRASKGTVYIVVNNDTIFTIIPARIWDASFKGNIFNPFYNGIDSSLSDAFLYLPTNISLLSSNRIKVSSPIPISWLRDIKRVYPLIFDPTITIFTGTFFFGGSVPYVYTWQTGYEQRASQILVQQSLIGMSGNITSISYLQYSNNGIANSNATIKLKHTTTSAITSPIFDVSWPTINFSGSLNFSSGAPNSPTWRTVPLTPFLYNNIDNLMIESRFVNSSTSPFGDWYYVQTGYQAHRWGYCNCTTYPPSSTFYSGIPSFTPVIQLTISSSCSATSPSSCTSTIGSPANGLHHYTNLSCSPVTGVSGYFFEYSFNGFSWNPLVSSSTFSWSVDNGDNPNIPIYYRVSTYCGSVYSPVVNASPFPIYTACDDPATPTVNGATSSSLNVTLNTESPMPNPSYTTYSIYCSTTGQYVQASGVLGFSPVYQTKSSWGTVTVTGLSGSTTYCFYAIAQNAQGDLRYNSSNSMCLSTLGSCITPPTPPNPTVASSSCGSATISWTGAPPSGTIWYWQNTACGVSTGFGSGPTFTASTGGTYFIRAFNAAGGGCWSPGCGSVTATITASPSFSASHTNTTCYGCSNGSIFITASGGTPPYQYSLNGGGWSSFFSPSITIPGLPAGSYLIQIRDATSCISTSTASDTILQPPHINSIGLSQYNIIAGNSIAFSSSVSGGAITWSWTFSGGTPPSTITSSSPTPTVVFNNPNTGGFYTVTLQTFNGAGPSNVVSANFTVQPNTSACIPPGNYVIQQGYHSAHVAEPINLATGSYEYKHTDINIPAVNGSLTFTRYYNTVNNSLNGPLGFGWSHSYNFYVLNHADTLWTVHYGDGHTSYFIPLINGLGTSFPLYGGTYETLYRDPSTLNYTLKFKNGDIYLFDVTGKLLSITDLNGNSTLLSYSGSDLISITAPGGRTLRITNIGGQITSITDTLGRTILFNYLVGNLVSATDQNGHATGFLYDGLHNINAIVTARGDTLLQNSYDGQSRVIGQMDALHLVTHITYDSPAIHYTAVTYPDGSMENVHHDVFSRLIHEIDELGFQKSYTYDYNNNLNKVIDEKNQLTSYQYDTIGNCLNIGAPLGVSYQFSYDSLNKLVNLTDPLSQNDSIVRDSNGNTLGIYLPDGSSRHFTYYSNGLVHTCTDGESNVTSYAYNTLGDLVSITSPAGIKTFSYDAAGRLTSKTDENGNTTTYRLDDADNLTTIKNALNDSLLYTYDPDNNPISHTDKNGYQTTYVYDHKDRLYNVSDPMGDSTLLQYDLRDNINKVTDANGHYITYGHDVKNRLDSITNSLGTFLMGYDSASNITSYTNAIGNVTHYGYDSLNRRARISDPLGNTISLAYDPLTRIKKITDPLSRTTQYNYTPTGFVNNIIDAATHGSSVTYNHNSKKLSITDANSHTQYFRYDSASRPTGYTNAAGGTDSLVYDSVGNVKKVITPTGTIVRTFDAANRLTNEAISSGDNYTFGYDHNDNLISIGNNTGTSTFQYDSVNRLKQYNGLFRDTVKYKRDKVGNIVAITYPGGHQVRYAYNGNNLMDTVTDWLGNITTYSYDANGRLLQTHYPNGILCSYAYDAAGRLDTQTTSSGATIIAQSIFIYNANGERIQEIRAGPLPKHYIAESGARTYAGDDHILTAPSATFIFDGAGNRIGQTDLSGTTSYHYSADNLLNSIATPSGTIAFQYDALGTKVAWAQGGIARRQVIDYSGSLPRTLMEEDTSGTVKVTYIYGIGLLARIDSAGNIQYYHFDAQHNTVALSDTAGHITDNYVYFSSGKLLSHTGNTQQPHTFLGEYGIYQVTASLYNLNARWYDAENRLFLNKDIYPASLSNPQTLNRYVYGLNNSVSMFDPSGLLASCNDNGNGNYTGDPATPWQVGMEWLTGKGPRARYFTNGDPFTELLRQHSHIAETRSLIIRNIINGGPLKGEDDYTLSGLQGIPHYFVDYSAILTNGYTGNLAAAYLGSYNLKYNVISIQDHSALVEFHVTNASTIASATHFPVLGYFEWWDNNIGEPLDRHFSVGPLSRTTQDFDWKETLTW